MKRSDQKCYIREVCYSLALGLSVVLCVLSLCTALDAVSAARAQPRVVAETTLGSSAWSYDDYAATLGRYVDDVGLVNYRGLQNDSAALRAFAVSLQQLDRAAFEAWDEPARLAFWINAYNALTLVAIIDHYPIQASIWKSVIFPANSIRQIAGVWDELRFGVMGRHMTLDEIEHDVLRVRFGEPRIHMALVCAAMGCPPLRGEPFSGELLDAQLDDQARRFLVDGRKFLVDRKNGRVELSPIFKWFGGDFVADYVPSQRFPGRGETERAVLNFVSAYLDEEQLDYLVRGTYRLAYLDYDWSLNEQGFEPG